MNLVYDNFDFTFGITGLWSFCFVSIIILVSTLFCSFLYSLFLELILKNLKPSVSEGLAWVLAFITSLLILSFHSTLEIDTDDYKALHTKLELYSENEDVRHALKIAIADKKVSKAEYSRLKRAFEDAKRNDARIVIEKYEQEIKNKVINP